MTRTHKPPHKRNTNWPREFVIRRKSRVTCVTESCVSMLKLAGLSLTGHFEAVSPTGKRCLWGRQLGFGGHLSHSTSDKMTPHQMEPGGGHH